MRRLLQLLPQRVLQQAVLDDEGKLPQACIVGAEVEARGAIIANYTHRLDTRNAFRRQALPRAATLQKRS
jgi:hypothetical protein